MELAEFKSMIGFPRIEALQAQYVKQGTHLKAEQNLKPLCHDNNSGTDNEEGNMLTIRKGLRFVTTVAAAALLAALVGGFAHAGGATLRMSAEPSDVGLMHWWAMDKGIFKKNGLDYTFTQVNTAAIALQAIGANSNDVVSLTEPPIVFNVTKGVGVTIVGAVALGQGVFKLVRDGGHERRTAQRQESHLDGGNRRRIRLDLIPGKQKDPAERFPVHQSRAV